MTLFWPRDLSKVNDVLSSLIPLVSYLSLFLLFLYLLAKCGGR